MHQTLPKILISNDDGVHAEGIRALAQALTPLGKVIIVAPATDQSAVSHAMSLRTPLRLLEHEPIRTPHGDIDVYAVTGTPTDAVYMAAHHILLGDKPNLVVSGINHGANLGNDVLYSGTVSAAMEGVFLGIPSVAVSLVGTHTLDFSDAAQFSYALCRSLLRSTPPEGLLLNVNVPKRIRKPGYAITKLGQHQYAAAVESRSDPRGQKYYWIGGKWDGFQDLPGTDCKAIDEGQISVTPLEIKLTGEKFFSWTSALKIEGVS